MRSLFLAVALVAGASAPALAQDAAAGERVFTQCRACHQVGETAKNAVGPVLNGLFGRKAGTVEGYSYSAANKNSGLTWDDGEYHGPCTMISVGNNPRTGGVFYTVPHASPFDGKLSFVHAYVPTRREILSVLPRLMKPEEGNYTEHPDVHEIHCTWIKIHTEPTTPVHSDGEIIDYAAQEIEYKIHPGRLNILIDPTA